MVTSGLAESIAVLGLAKLGVAAIGAPALIGEEEETEVGYGDSLIHKRQQRQRQQRKH